MKITKQYLYSGNYRNEFGGNEDRIWKRFYILIDNNFCGELYIEPADYLKRFRYRNGDDFLSAENYEDLKDKIKKLYLTKNR